MSVRIVARSVRGLESVLAGEIEQRLPAIGLVETPREIAFELPSLDAGLLDLRTADDAFLVVGTIDGMGRAKDVPPAAARRIAELDWATALDVLGGLRPFPSWPLFDVVVSLEGKRNFNRFDLENATGAALAPVIGARHLARTRTSRPEGDPALTVRVFVHGPDAVVALRIADRPLHRRAWKVDTGPGTLHPPVAAAMVRLAGVTAADLVVDPFCGDGTLAVEAALGCPGVRVEASDIDPGRLVNASRNVSRAGVAVSLSRRDAAELSAPSAVLITNPPWNVAVEAQGLLARSLDGFWEGVSGRFCVVADASLDVGRVVMPSFVVRVRLAGRVSDLVVGGVL